MRILSYNIHKGFTAGNLGFVLKRIKEGIRETKADIVLLQEVVGHHDEHASRIRDWPTVSQFEFLADTVWPHFAYGRNAVYTSGHHGNAILSRYPISSWENEDVSPSRFERRGLLHAAIELPEMDSPFHVICVHLALFETDRRAQIHKLGKRIAAMVPKGAPLVVGGDFNDWRGSISPVLKKDLGLEEAFLDRAGRHARTYPSWLPVLGLDRIYYRGLRCTEARGVAGRRWSQLSDHLPILATFDLRGTE
jgi:endonuclease/exonuclease/phosphatase family metal-dependent hydrolase